MRWNRLHLGSGMINPKIPTMPKVNQQTMTFKIGFYSRNLRRVPQAMDYYLHFKYIPLRFARNEATQMEEDTVLDRDIDDNEAIRRTWIKSRRRPRRGRNAGAGRTQTEGATSSRVQTYESAASSYKVPREQ